MSSVDCEAKLVIHRLIETMQEFIKDWDSLPIRSKDRDKEEGLHRRLDIITIHIRSFLPKDPNLSEIDDLFIPTTNQETLSGTYSGESMTLLFDNSLKFYSKILTKINTMYEHEVELDPIHFSTFTELNMLSDCTETDICTSVSNREHLRWLSLSVGWNFAYVWRSLKAFRVFFMKHREYVIHYDSSFCDKLRRRIPWLIKLKDIPQAKSKEKQRLTSWISRQVAAILEGLDCSFIYNDKHNFTLWTGDHESYVYNLIQNKAPNIEVIDNLHTYFMSSNDENQRVQLMDSFIKGCLKAYKRPTRPSRKPEELLFLKYFGKLTKAFHEYIWVVLVLEQFSEEKWNELEKYYGNKFEPYLAEYRNNTSVVHEWNSQRINEKSKNTLDGENKEEPPEDLAMEKYIFFDGFLNRLRVMSILREALWKTADVIQMDKSPEYYETLAFRTSSLRSLKSDYSTALNGFRCDYVRTWTYVAMKICPFIFLSKHHEYLMEDLFKFLNDEVVDEATLDELYFAKKSIPSFVKAR